MKERKKGEKKEGRKERKRKEGKKEGTKEACFYYPKFSLLYLGKNR